MSGAVPVQTFQPPVFPAYGEGCAKCAEYADPTAVTAMTRDSVVTPFATVWRKTGRVACTLLTLKERHPAQDPVFLRFPTLDFASPTCSRSTAANPPPRRAAPRVP